jgi:uncharacterized protein DUF6624
MPLLLLLALLLPLESTQLPVNPRDPELGARIKELLHTELTSDEENSDAEDAAVKEIFRRHGLPTIGEVGEEAAYEFVLLLAGDKLLPELQDQVLPKIRAAVAHHELPADAGVYYEARVRVEESKRLARSRPPSNPGLRDRIEGLVKADQEVRQQKGFDVAKMNATDARNAPALQQILDNYGVPTFAMVGPQAAGDFILMIQHQPPQFRQQVLPRLKALVDSGQADPGSYALVYDLSQRDLGKKQLYGERLECGTGEKMHEAPIEDESHVNQRRAELGLMRVELYASLVAELMPQFCQPATQTPIP